MKDMKKKIKIMKIISIKIIIIILQIIFIIIIQDIKIFIIQVQMLPYNNYINKKMK